MNFCLCCEDTVNAAVHEVESLVEDAPKEKVLVLCATGKVGRNVCKALSEKGFDVFGTTRKVNNDLKSRGAQAVVCDYTNEKNLVAAFRKTGAKKAFIITDYFKAAKCKPDLEVAQGRMMVEVCKRVGCDFVVFCSVCDPDLMNDKVKHIKTKLAVETYLQSSGMDYTILRPCCFFENLDAPEHYNPLKKGQVKFITSAKIKWCATLDIGKAAAACFKDTNTYNSRIINVQSWEGTLADVAKALETVSGTKVKHRLNMPLCIRSCMIPDLHNMCLYFETNDVSGSIDKFKSIVPDAMSAEDWFRFHGRYNNGEAIVKKKK